jgi:hypothetical protein
VADCGFVPLVVEITQLNKKIIEATKKDVTVRIVIQPPKTGGTVEAFRPVKNHVRLFVPLFEGFSRPFDDRSAPPPRFTRQMIVDRLPLAGIYVAAEIDFLSLTPANLAIISAIILVIDVLLFSLSRATFYLLQRGDPY